jgi:dienelactone hydrolase
MKKIKDNLPPFYKKQVERLTFPMAWQHQQAKQSYQEWRAQAQKIYLEHLGPAPVATSFDIEYIGQEDRGSYVANKLMLNINDDCRVKAYLLVPKGEGPFPAMVALHDHGAHFAIGKEKVIRPFDEPQAVIDDAAIWAKRAYEDVFIGDALAERGYVVMAIDALYWGERGREEGFFDTEYLRTGDGQYQDIPTHQAQQDFGSNMFHLGLTWAGYIIWDDMRSVEFLKTLASVDNDKIGCIGLSMGSFRAWHLAAASDDIACSVAIAWLSDTVDFMTPNQNITKGKSAFSMVLPGLRNYLDYPDVASIACPKPMLFFNGTKDALFGIDGVNRCYEKMAEVWKSQNSADNLYCKWWEEPHHFNLAMQQDAFAWLDGKLGARS